MRFKEIVIALFLTSITSNLFAQELINLEFNALLKKTSLEQNETNPEDKSLLIKKTSIKPITLNSIGIIPHQITGVDKYLWVDLEEENLANSLISLSFQNFYTAQTFLKRILISELDPPKNSAKSTQKGQYYFLAKIDKLIEIGALEEAETLISQTSIINSEIFDRWVKVSLLTGRITRMCKQLKKKPTLSNNLSLRIICLARLNDWDAAAMILSSGVALNRINDMRETLLINYLDPNIIEDLSNLKFSNQSDEIDFYIRILNDLPGWQKKNQPAYNVHTLVHGKNKLERILAAEKLVKTKAITNQPLFDLYKTAKISGHNEVWKRVTAIKNLELSLKRNNHLNIGIALKNAIAEMRSAKLLAPFAFQYSQKLWGIPVNQKRNDFNDGFALVFALSGEIPPSWQDYKSDNYLINNALKIHKKEYFTSDIVAEKIELAFVNISTKLRKAEFKERDSKLSKIKTAKGNLILKALNLLSNGVETDTDILSEAITYLNEAEEYDLIDAILTEYIAYKSQEV